MPNIITNSTRQRLSMHGLAFFLSTCAFALANPMHLREAGVLLVRKDDDSGPTTIWTPTVIILVVFSIFGLFGCFTTAYLRRIRGINATEDATPVETRQLTAEQLAGAINGDAATNNATRRTRRPRRPRRTPSQMSVTSLPEYMKEPGAEEVVIFRGQSLDEATTMPAAVVMDTLDEDIEDGISQRYSLIPTSPNDQPLLHDESEEAGNIPLQNLSQDVITRRSFGSGSNDTNSLARVDTGELIGPSPAYFEVVDEDPLAQPLDDRSFSTANSSASPTPSHDRPSRRRSGFRIFLNRMSATTGHQRNGSGNSAVSAVSIHHRTTASASSSFLNSLRPLSRQRSTRTPSLGSNSRLESPSVISLGSISSPLTHTAVRTGFTYPKSGPTPEQLKIIASMESIGKFAVPYGRDAIAFAASTSRHELDLPPPPGFDSEEDPPEPTHLASASIGPSGLRSLTSAVADDVEDQDIAVGGLGGSSALDIGDDEQPAPLSPLLTLDIPSAGSSKTHTSSVPTDDTPSKTPSIHKPQLKSNLTLLNPSSTNLAPSEFGQTLSLPSGAGPPSSFHSPSAYYLRSESVVSMHSTRTYATAAESLDTPSSARSFVTVGSNSDVDSDSEFELPSTPKMANGHELELTDITVRQVQVGSSNVGGVEW